MIPTDRFFDGKTKTIYEGKLYSRLYTVIDAPGKYCLSFEFISTNSKYEQYIGLSMYCFKGAVKLNGEKVKLRKGVFSGMKFSEKTAPKQFTAEIIVEEGEVNVFNGADGWIMDTIHNAEQATPAMIVEKNGENSYVFHCNDYVYDDDFDDLVFSLEVTKLE